MSLVLVSFVGPLGPLFTLVAIAATGLIVALYFLRVERRRYEVPFLGLFDEWLGSARAAAFRSRLTRLFSLLLALFLLGLLLLALADPRSEDTAGEGRSIVVLVDVSASMDAADVAPSRFEKARGRVRELVRGLGPHDRMLLVEMGARPRPLGGFSGDPEALEARLDSLGVLDTGAGFGAALRLALDVLQGEPSPEIVLASDGALALDEAREIDRRGVPLRFESAAPPPRPPANVAFGLFAARRYPLGAGSFELIAEILNEDDADVPVELVVRDATKGRVLEVRSLVVTKRSRARVTIRDLAGAESAHALEARLTRKDGKEDVLARDDVAFAVVPRPTRSRVLVVGPPNQFLDAALLVDEGVELVRTDAAGYAKAGSFDWTIFDGTFPERHAETGPALYLRAPQEDARLAFHPLTMGARLTDFGFDHWEKKHPIFRVVDPYDVQVLTGRVLVPGPNDSVLGRSERGAILVEGTRPEGRFLALGFDPVESDFVLRAEFPLFLHLVSHHLVPSADEASNATFVAGEPWHFVVPGGISGRVEVRGPLTTSDDRARNAPTMATELFEGRGVVRGERAGIFEVRGVDPPLFLAANLPAGVESREAPRREIVLGESKLEPVRGLVARSRGEPWVWLVGALFVLSLFEWLSYHRRWTV